MRKNTNQFAQTHGSGGVVDAGVEASFADSKSLLPHHVAINAQKEDENSFRSTSPGSAEGRSGGTVSRYPTTKVDISALGQDSIEALDDALEQLFPLENIEDSLLKFHAENFLPAEVDDIWPSTEDGGDLEVDFCVGSTQRNVQHVRHPHKLATNGLDSNRDVTKTRSKSIKQGQRKGLYERQQRYRERKKNKEKEVEESLDLCLKNIEELKRQNKAISWKNESLLMMHSYLDESVSQLGHEKKSCQDEESIDGQKVDLAKEIKQFGLALSLDRIMCPFLENRKKPGISVVEKLSSYVFSNWDREAREKCQLKIQEKLSMFLRHYFDAPNQEVSDEYEQKMRILIETRRRLADFMVQYHPEFVMARVLDGWVEEGFDPTLMGEDRIEIESSCLSCLISNLGLSKSQIEESNTAWMQFVASWNNEVKVHNSLVRDLEKRMVWSSMYERGIHVGMNASLELRDALNKFGDRSKIRAMMILRLSNQMHDLMSPVQIARLNTFYPGHTPNWVCVASLTHRLANR